MPPSAILAVTFTNKAAGEMRARVASLLAECALDSDAQRFRPFTPSACGCCAAMAIRWRAIRPGFTRRFTIYDDEDQLAIIKAAYRALGLDEKEFMQYRAALSQHQPAPRT